jgi:GT2 family glycosyltransferase
MALNPGLERAACEGARGPSGSPLTAAVCTRGRPERLRRALLSLVAQSTPLFEILVIDNAGDGEPSAAAVASEFPSVRYIAQPSPGLDTARNTALHHARTPLLAFLDDDAAAHPSWGDHLVAAFDDPRVAAVTGRVDPLALDTDGRRLFEANGGFARGDERIELPRDARRPLHGMRAPLIAWAVSIGSGCSLAVRRDAALAIGCFDEHLDNGATLPGGGDHDLLWRLLQAGHSVVYEPGALAWHEHRTHTREAIAQIAGHQRALVAFLVKSARRAPLLRTPPIVLFLLWRLVKPGARLMRRMVRRDPLPARALLAMWRDCARGLSAYSPAAAPQA